MKIFFKITLTTFLTAFIFSTVTTLSFAADDTNTQLDPDCPQEYFYRGYDYVMGNPVVNGGDPGWRLPIILNGQEALTCHWAQASGGYRYYETTNELAYYKQLDQKVTVFEYIGEEDMLKPTAFTGSADFEYQRRDVFDNDLINIQSEAWIQQFDGMIAPYPGGYIFSPDFLSALAEFPVSTEELDWFDKVKIFFTNYGTHMMGKSSLGALWIYESQFTKENYLELALTGDLYVGLTASAEYYRSNGASVAYESERNTKARLMVERYAEKQRPISVGTQPPSDAHFTEFLGEWDDVMEPIPTSFDLNAISELLSADMFPNDPDIESKRKVMEAGYRLYCDSIANCHIPVSLD